MEADTDPDVGAGDSKVAAESVELMVVVGLLPVEPRLGYVGIGT